MKARALIAEDEPLLAASLAHELAQAWPELEIVERVADGQTALQKILELQPDVVFLDIQMPGLTGLDVAEALAHREAETALPMMVFVTAYDEYAVQAFENQALDYVLKPVRQARLAKTVMRLQQRLQQPLESAETAQQNTLKNLAQLLLQTTQATAPNVSKLRMIQASKHSGTIQMIPIEDVVYFEAADKYVRVLTAGEEFLIRTPIKELLAQLDTEKFWQVHRGTIVRVESIASVQRDEFCKVSLQLHRRPETLAVSRLYAHLFKAM